MAKLCANRLVDIILESEMSEKSVKTKKVNGVIRLADRKQLEEYQRRHEKSLLKILIAKLPDDARKMLEEMKAA